MHPDCELNVYMHNQRRAHQERASLCIKTNFLFASTPLSASNSVLLITFLLCPPLLGVVLPCVIFTQVPVFVPHGTFHVWNTVTVPGGVALIGGGRHVATIASLSSQWPVDRLAPVLVINGSGTVVSDLVVQANVLVGSNNVPGSSSLLAVRAGGAVVRRAHDACVL